MISSWRWSLPLGIMPAEQNAGGSMENTGKKSVISSCEESKNPKLCSFRQTYAKYMIVGVEWPPRNFLEPYSVREEPRTSERSRSPYTLQPLHHEPCLPTWLATLPLNIKVLDVLPVWFVILYPDEANHHRVNPQIKASTFQRKLQI